MLSNQALRGRYASLQAAAAARRPYSTTRPAHSPFASSTSSPAPGTLVALQASQRLSPLASSADSSTSSSGVAFVVNTLLPHLAAASQLLSRRGPRTRSKDEGRGSEAAAHKASSKKSDGGGGGGGGNNGGEDPDTEWAYKPQAVLLISLVSGMVWWLIYSNRNARPDKEISWQVFRDTLLGTEDVAKVKVVLGHNRAVVKVYMRSTGYTYWFTVSSLKAFERMLAEAEGSLNILPSNSLQVLYDDRIELVDLAPIIGVLLWVAVLYRSATTVRAARAGGMNPAAAEKGKFKPVSTSNTRFKDVAGMAEPKREIQEFVDFMKYPERFTKLGAKVPSGAILFGPPGTGKTLLAKAISGESGVPFYSVCGSDFVEMYVGVGASRVRELFAAAKKHPRAIIYIDEIDAVGRKRGGSMMSGGSSERENTLNQLLIEMDGFKKQDGKIIVLASTNVSPSSLDEALLRPGRFDRQVYIDLPTVKEREEIFQTHLETINLVPKIDYVNVETEKEKDLARCDAEKREMLGLPPTEAAAAAADGAAEGEKEAAPKEKEGKGRGRVKAKETEESKDDDEAFGKAVIANSARVKAKVSSRMAQLSPGFAGADIANICNEGALIAARQKKVFVDLDCMEKAIDRVIGGIEKRSRVMSDFEKRAVAYHEAGHAVVGWFLENCHPLMKISIVPRGSNALGYAQYLPSERTMRSYQQIFDEMCMTLGGRASELYHFKHLSTGARDDLSKVTRSAYTAVATFGMARHKLGKVVSYAAPGTSESNVMKPYSQEVSEIIDEEAKLLVDKAFKATMDLIHEKREEIEKIAEHLLKHEVITRQDFIDLIGPRPFEEEDLPPSLV